MSRRFEVQRTSAEGHVEFTISTVVSEAALAHFVLALQDGGHSKDAVETTMTRLTLAAMDGRDEFVALDPDLKGTTRLHIIG